MLAHGFQQQLMVDVVEETPDVKLDDPVVLPVPPPHHRHRIERRAPGTVAEGVAMKAGFQHGFQDPLDHCLCHPICHGGHAQHPHAP